MICSKCGKHFEKNLNKTDTLTYIRNFKSGNDILCEECDKAKKREIQNELRITAEEREEARNESSFNYINNYLNVNKSWLKGIKTNSKIIELSDRFVNWEIISEHILCMDYSDFLQTPYWKAIAEKVRQRAGFKCQMCNSNEGLHVHHRTYEHHGDEIHHMEDLICLCHSCHEKYHIK